jgi:hypothetical protein
MSLKASVWAIEAQVRTADQRLVLIQIANVANSRDGNGPETYSGAIDQLLADNSRMTLARWEKTLAGLARLGLIRRSGSRWELVGA